MKIGASLLTLRKRGRSYDGTKLDNTAHLSDPEGNQLEIKELP